MAMGGATAANVYDVHLICENAVATNYRHFGGNWMPITGASAAVANTNDATTTAHPASWGLTIALDATDGVCTCANRRALIASGVDPKCHFKYATTASLTDAQCVAVTDNSGVAS